MNNIIRQSLDKEQNNKCENKRFIWLDQLRAIAMLLVVLGHCALPSKYIKYIYSFHMPLFFMISGMTFRSNKYSDIEKLIKDKWKKLILPHFYMNMLMLPLWIYTFKILSKAKPNLITLIKGIFYINSGKYQSPSNATWFLGTLFIVEIMFYILYKFSKGDSTILIISIIICGIVGFIESINKSNYEGPWHIEASLTAIVFYMIGYFFMKYFKYLDKKTNKDYVFFMLVFLIIGSYFSIENGRVSFNGNSYDSIIYFYIAAIFISLFFIMLVIKMPRISILSYIGKNTILYLGIHIPLIRLFEKSNSIFISNHLYALILGMIIYCIMIPIVYFINKSIPFISGKVKENDSRNKKLKYLTIIVYIIITIELIPYAI